MPIPRHSMALASVQLPQVAECDGVTELRVHGVGGSPPDAILGDLAPEQASGDKIAGFYRSGDHRADLDDESAGRDANRHVEVYSWGGLTSQSKVRVLWLALLPFLLTNLAGWMGSAKTAKPGWRFTLHRLSHGLSGLALTVNAALVAVLVGADLLAHQAVRAGLAGHQWWLAPLGWHYIAGFPARQLLIGMLVPVLFRILGRPAGLGHGQPHVGRRNYGYGRHWLNAAAPPAVSNDWERQRRGRAGPGRCVD
jgi:hypothetical protein